MSEPLSISSITANVEARAACFNDQEPNPGKGRNVYVGNGGNDVVSNYTDNSVLLLGDGDNVVISAGNKNTIESGRGKDQIVALGNKNYISSGAGDDKIYFQGNESTIFGRSGNDYIVFAGKKNNISGGTGNDDIYSATLKIMAQYGQIYFGDISNLKPYSFDIDEDPEVDENESC